jgi:thiosulfate/3-mercaptopyruvate sulfurtransferase
MTAAARAGFTGYAHPEWLVDGAWLKARRDDPSVKIIAVTPFEAYEAGHIPGAHQIDWPDLGLAETSEPAISAWHQDVQARIARLGVRSSDTVVLYDDGTLLSARLWWVLDLLGHVDKRLLNGGLPAWTLAGGELETGAAPADADAEPYSGLINPLLIATLDDVAGHLGDPTMQLVDARPREEYAGGYIPGAINHPFLLNAESGSVRVWKSADTLNAVFYGLGITPEKVITAYCATGVQSSVTFFTLRLLGYPLVRLYTGSWNEWSSRADLPIALA